MSTGGAIGRPTPSIVPCQRCLPSFPSCSRSLLHPSPATAMQQTCSYQAQAAACSSSSRLGEQHLAIRQGAAAPRTHGALKNVNAPPPRLPTTPRAYSSHLALFRLQVVQRGYAAGWARERWRLRPRCARRLWPHTSMGCISQPAAMQPPAAPCSPCKSIWALSACRTHCFCSRLACSLLPPTFASDAPCRCCGHSRATAWRQRRQTA